MKKKKERKREREGKQVTNYVCCIKTVKKIIIKQIINK